MSFIPSSPHEFHADVEKENYPMAVPPASETGPIAAVLGLADNTLIAIVVVGGAILGSVASLWRVLTRIDHVEAEQVKQLQDLDKLARAIEPLSTVPAAIDDIRDQLRVIIQELLADRRRERH